MPKTVGCTIAVSVGRESQPTQPAGQVGVDQKSTSLNKDGSTIAVSVARESQPANITIIEKESKPVAVTNPELWGQDRV